MSEKPKLTVIEGDREALELEALLNMPKDFQKFVEFFRTRAPVANGKLKLVGTPTLDSQIQSDSESKPE